jgi:hypothetical protein
VDGNSEKDEGCDYYKVGIVAVVAVVAPAAAGSLASGAHLVRVFLQDHHLACACHDDWRTPAVEVLACVADLRPCC